MTILYVPYSLDSWRVNLIYFTEMCSSSEAGSYLRLIDFVDHSTLGLRVIKKKKEGVECTAVGVGDTSDLYLKAMARI